MSFFRPLFFEMRLAMILIFVGSVYVGNYALAQDYKPLLDHTNEWHFTNCYFGCLTDVYYTSGDTLVAGNNYKILDGFHYISRSFLLREDVPAQRVYLRKLSNNGNGQEYLLYDFSLEEGESMQMYNPITPFPEYAGTFVVDSIRARILEDGQAYKHYYFSPDPTNNISDNNCVWVEGVGSLSIINAPSGLPDINGVGHLSCFFKQGELFYTNLDSISGCSPTLGNRPPQVLLKPRIVVDPAAQIIHVQSNSVFDALKLYNVNGQLLAQQAITPQTRFAWPMNLTQGIYFVAVGSTERGQQSIVKIAW